MKFLADHFALIVLIVMILFPITYALGFGGRDTTDSTTSRKRSGMTLYTDHGTGCQYLKVGMFSNLTPRLNPDGTQKCLEKNSER